MARLAFLLGLLSFHTAPAQTSLKDSALYSLAISTLTASYMDSLKGSIHLYNGAEYTGFYVHTLGHPFFGSDSLQKGDIFYDGMLYRNIAMSYNLATDEIYIKDFTSNYNIKLINDKIGYFSLPGHLFVKPDPGIGPGSLSFAGFYELIYDKDISVLVKHIKQLKSGFKAEDLMKFVEYDKYFIKHNNRYYPVDGQSSLIAIFGDHGGDIKKFLRRNHDHFKKDPGKAIIKTAEFVNQFKR